jgi:hypothetical protein
MRDDVQLVLTRGIAAAKSSYQGSVEEARGELQRVLRAVDAESDQKAEAWLWLSRITNDPAERRRCLESALAMDPGHGEAHQLLAILDGRLKPEDIVGPHASVQPVSPNSSLSVGEVRRFACPKCGGILSFSAGQLSLTCSHCGAAVTDPVTNHKEETVKEQDFFAVLPTAKARRWEYPIERTVRCEGCGATFILPAAEASGECPFCRSTHVVTASISDLIQPSGMLPFQFDREEAAHHMREWLARQRFCPSDLATNAAIDRPQGVYSPFWTFDMGGAMNWRAMVAEENGHNRQWVSVTGVHLVYADDLLVPASRSVPQELADTLFDFDTKALVPYSADFIPGYTAEIYQIPLEEASLVARKRVLQAARNQEEVDSLSGKRYRDFVMNSAGMTVDSFKLVLLPLWLCSYRYREQTFPLAVNGHSGTVAGRVPRSGFQQFFAKLFGGSR